jgi:hypothetical protein
VELWCGWYGLYSLEGTTVSTTGLSYSDISINGIDLHQIFTRLDYMGPSRCNGGLYSDTKNLRTCDCPSCLQRRDSLVNAVGSVVVLTDLTPPVRIPPRDPFYVGPEIIISINQEIKQHKTVK